MALGEWSELRKAMQQHRVLSSLGLSVHVGEVCLHQATGAECKVGIRLRHQMEMIPTTEAPMSREQLTACQGSDDSESQPLPVDVRTLTLVAWYSMGVFRVAIVTGAGCRKGEFVGSLPDCAFISVQIQAVCHRRRHKRGWNNFWEIHYYKAFHPQTME